MNWPGGETVLPASALPLATDARLTLEGGRHFVRYRFDMPYFAFAWRPLLRRRARAIEAAADAGLPLPADLPWWAPPATQTPGATAAVACICLISGVWAYAGGTGGLLTQTLPYAADRYGVGDTELGTGLALVRIGVALALVLALVADRAGRRRFIAIAAVAHCLLAAAIGLAPTFASYIAAHVLLRCLDTALGVALGVLAVESVPAANRATTLALVLLANGAGLVCAVAVLPLADAGDAGFAAVYALQLLGLPLVINATRRLRESSRFDAHRDEPHRYRELLRAPYLRHTAVVGIAGMLAAIFAAPTVEFLNRYLDDVHGFSSYEIVAFLAITGTPSFAMLVLGGRLSDVRGRKRVGVPLLLAGTAAFAAFYLASGAWLWILFFLAAALSSAGGAALAPYSSELFPYPGALGRQRRLPRVPRDGVGDRPSRDRTARGGYRCWQGDCRARRGTARRGAHRRLLVSRDSTDRAGGDERRAVGADLIDRSDQAARRTSTGRAGPGATESEATGG